TDFGGKTSIFSHPVYLFLREFSLQDFRGGSTFKLHTHFYGINKPEFFCIDDDSPDLMDEYFNTLLDAA
ncbi:hypothetical protein, partial [Escherichia coli]|uniref:hypothetical protein n=1 Tax=Escherichia coli TaxID=562 RepID=UPI001A7E13F1